MHLIHTKGPKADQACEAGDELISFRGEKAVYVRGIAPRNERSSGRVVITEEKLPQEHGYYPSVYDLKWVEDDSAN